MNEHANSTFCKRKYVLTETIDLPKKKIHTIDNQANVIEKQPELLINTEETEQLTFFNGTEVSKLTKRQLKKYKRMLRWNEAKKEKRAKERLKTKLKKTLAKENNIDLGPSRKQLKQSKMCNSTCKTSVVIDLGFDDLMIDKVSIVYLNISNSYNFFIKMLDQI